MSPCCNIATCVCTHGCLHKQQELNEIHETYARHEAHLEVIGKEIHGVIHKLNNPGLRKELILQKLITEKAKIKKKLELLERLKGEEQELRQLMSDIETTEKQHNGKHE